MMAWIFVFMAAHSYSSSSVSSLEAEPLKKGEIHASFTVQSCVDLFLQSYPIDFNGQTEHFTEHC